MANFDTWLGEEDQGGITEDEIHDVNLSAQQHQQQQEGQRWQDDNWQQGQRWQGWHEWQ